MTTSSNTATAVQIPRFVTYTSPVFSPASDGASTEATALPLNLVALIVAHLDDLGDIARVTRTSRLLYYMTLPQLYSKVNLHSYPEIRYVSSRPEGFGSGSPFTMALNGLVTGPHASLVQEFRVWGQWRDLGIDGFAKGRIPDKTMMLNILVRAATDRMTKMKSFSWELDCKPLKTLYQGLGAHNTLTSLTIKFPSSRSPRPSVIVPPMANLRAFRAIDIDPLCYPDDISVLLLSSKKLVDLRLHFSPRMRQEAESSLSMDTYFGRCLRAGHKLRLKHFAIQNFYGPNSQRVSQIVDHDTCQSISFLDMFGGVRGNSANVFLDDTWKNIPHDMKTNFRTTRCNEPAPQHVTMISHSSGLERFYFVNAQPPMTGRTPSSPDAPATPSETPPDQDSAALGRDYIYAFTRHHGSTLKHILLSDQWSLSEEDIGDIIRYCPNLEQLGLAVNHAGNLNTMRLLIPFLPKLQALRLLSNEPLEQKCKTVSPGQHLIDLGRYVEKMGAPRLKWVGVSDSVFKIGGRIEHLSDDGSTETIREMSTATWEDVKHVAIWGLDVLDIAVDPVAPFGP